jgi:hypothetical protein
MAAPRAWWELYRMEDAPACPTGMVASRSIGTGGGIPSVNASGAGAGGTPQSTPRRHGTRTDTTHNLSAVVCSRNKT